MKMNKKSYRIVTFLLIACFMLTMFTGCNEASNEEGTGSSISMEDGYTAEEAATTKVMVVGEYDVYLNEAMVYCLHEMYMQGVTADSLDEATIESHKGSILDSIRQIKIIGDVAKNNGFEISEEELATINKTVDNSKLLFGQELLDKYGITDEILYQVYLEQYTVEMFSNSIREEMGKSIYDDLYEAYKDYQFVGVYLVRFPTVQISDADEPVTDEAGAYVYVTDEEKKDILAKAEEAKAEIDGGADALVVAENYGVTAYSTERSGYIGGFSEDVNSQLEDMEVGQCTEIYEDDLGYGMIVLQSLDDGTDKEMYVSMQTNTTLTTEFETLQNMWLSTIPVDRINDMQGTAWEDFDLLTLVQDMNTALAEEK